MKRHLIRLIAAAIPLCLFLAAPAPAYADCDDEAAEADAGKVTVKMINGRKVYTIHTAIRVCGKVPRPTVLLLLPDRPISYEWDTLKKNFLPQVIKSAKKAPF